jgi:hypothetical protein
MEEEEEEEEESHHEICMMMMMFSLSFSHTGSSPPVASFSTVSSLKDGALTGAKMLTTTTAQCAVHVSL